MMTDTWTHHRSKSKVFMTKYYKKDKNINVEIRRNRILNGVKCKIAVLYIVFFWWEIVPVPSLINWNCLAFILSNPISAVRYSRVCAQENLVLNCLCSTIVPWNLPNNRSLSSFLASLLSLRSWRSISALIRFCSFCSSLRQHAIFTCVYCPEFITIWRICSQFLTVEWNSQFVSLVSLHFAGVLWVQQFLKIISTLLWVWTELLFLC